MTGLARALVTTELVTAVVAGSMAVREWRRRHGAPPTMPRAVVWVSLMLWALTTTPLAGPSVRPPWLVASLSIGSLGLTWNSLVRSRMPRLTRRRYVIGFLALPATALIALLTPASSLVVARSATQGGTFGPLGWALVAWLCAVVAGAAALQIAAAGQAVGPRRVDIVVDGAILLMVALVIAALFVLPVAQPAIALAPTGCALVLLWLWHQQDRPDRRVPLQVSSANVLDRVADALVLLGLDGVVIDANARARGELLVGVERRRWAVTNRPRLDPELLPTLAEDGERVVTLGNGRVELVRTTTVHELGRPVARILSARDITELENLRAQLADLAARDPLTGLRNRRHLTAQLAELIAHADRHGCPLTLAMVDLDNLKQLNDEHGHLVGDRALVQVAQVLRTQNSVDDVVVRTGGDEFIVVMPGRTGTDAAARAEQWRNRASLLDPVGDGRARVTLSVGVADWRTAMTPEELINAADEALYGAKAGGRDQVRTTGTLPTQIGADR